MLTAIPTIVKRWTLLRTSVDTSLQVAVHIEPESQYFRNISGIFSINESQTITNYVIPVLVNCNWYNNRANIELFALCLASLHISFMQFPAARRAHYIDYSVTDSFTFPLHHSVGT